MSTKAICVHCKCDVESNGRMTWWHSKNLRRECAPVYAAPMFVEDKK